MVAGGWEGFGAGAAVVDAAGLAVDETAILLLHPASPCSVVVFVVVFVVVVVVVAVAVVAVAVKYG